MGKGKSKVQGVMASERIVGNWKKHVNGGTRRKKRTRRGKIITRTKKNKKNAAFISKNSQDGTVNTPVNIPNEQPQ